MDLRETIGISLETKGDFAIGLCPFHEEETPSFVISDNGTKFKCLSCGVEGGSSEYEAMKEKSAFSSPHAHEMRRASRS